MYEFIPGTPHEDNLSTYIRAHLPRSTTQFTQPALPIGDRCGRPLTVREFMRRRYEHQVAIETRADVWSQWLNRRLDKR